MVFSNKKGQAIFDLVVLIIVVFVFAVVALFGGYIYNELNDEIQADTDFSTEAKASSQSVNDGYAVWFDNAIFFTIILLWIGLLITSFMIDTHPIFFIITVIFMIFVFIVGMSVSNAYDDIVSDSDLSGYSSNFPKTTFIFNNFLVVLIFIGLSTAAALYAKSGGGL